MSNALQSKAMLVNLSISAWTASKKDNKVSTAVKAGAAAQAKAGWFNKRLINPDALLELGRIEGRMRDMHYRFTLAWGDNGDRILPAPAFFEYTTQISTLKAEHENAVTAFCVNYPQLVQDARTMLGSMYDPGEYPAVESIRSRFGVRTVFTPVPDAADFRVDIGEAAVAEIRKGIVEAVEGRLKGATRECWVRLEETVKAIHERLGDPKAVFRDSLIENLRVLLDLLPKLNVAGDEQLEIACDNVRVYLLIDPGHLRKDKKLRAATADRAGSILKDIEKWMT